MPRDPDSGLTEPDIVINGRALTFAECMTVRVALSNFRIWLSDPESRAGIGEPLAGNYARHASTVVLTMLRGPRRGASDQRELVTIARGAWHMLQSLLAVREGIPDDSIRTMAAALDEAIVKAEGSAERRRCDARLPRAPPPAPDGNRRPGVSP